MKEMGTNRIEVYRSSGRVKVYSTIKSPAGQSLFAHERKLTGDFGSLDEATTSKRRATRAFRTAEVASLAGQFMPVVAGWIISLNSILGTEDSNLEENIPAYALLIGLVFIATSTKILSRGRRIERGNELKGLNELSQTEELSLARTYPFQA